MCSGKILSSSFIQFSFFSRAFFGIVGFSRGKYSGFKPCVFSFDFLSSIKFYQLFSSDIWKWIEINCFKIAYICSNKLFYIPIRCCCWINLYPDYPEFNKRFLKEDYWKLINIKLKFSWLFWWYWCINNPFFRCSFVREDNFLIGTILLLSKGKFS